MSGVLAIDEIRGKTSGTPTDVNNLKYQLATAWVNFNGTGTVAIRDSFNVSSITDNGVGDYTVNFAQAMDNADYTISGSAEAIGVGVIITPVTSSFLTSSIQIRSRYDDSTIVDLAHVSASIFGGKN